MPFEPPADSPATARPDVRSTPSAGAAAASQRTLAVSKWISFLRKYGPIPTNDNMYDEVIQRSMHRSRITPIRLPAAYLELAVANFSGNAPRSVIFTGTAGDGKTYHCRQVWLRLGGLEDEWNRGEPIQRIPITAGELVIVKDLTELGQNEGAALIQTMAEDLRSGTSGRYYLIAANHGQLMDKWRTAPETPAVRAIGRVVEELLVTGDSPEPSIKLDLHDLSAQSGAEMLPQVLRQVLEHPAWEECHACPMRSATGGCPIWENRTRLTGERDGGLFQRRLTALAELSEQNRVHFPIRQLLLLAANMLLGHPDVKDSLLTCEDVPTIVSKGTAHLASVYRNVFGENLPPRRREATDVFEKLSRFGIGDESSNRIDSILVYGADDSTLRPFYQVLLLADPIYGGTPTWQGAQRAYLEGEESGNGESGQNFLKAMRAQRQRLFFTIPDDQASELGLWELTVYRYAGLYLDVLQRVRLNEPAPRTALPMLVRGLNRIFTGMLVQNQDQLIMATGGSHSQSKTSRLLDAMISVPRDRGEEVSLVRHRRGLVLSVKLVRDGEPKPVTLPLTLLRFEFLCRVAEGSLPSSFSLECYEDLLAYKANVLHALGRRRQLDQGGEDTCDELTLQFIDLTAEGIALSQRVEVRLA